MLQHGDPGASIPYVSLGLFSSALLRELFAILDSEGAGIPKKETIENAILSLGNVENPVTTESLEYRHLAFRSYEAIITLFDVLESEQTQMTSPTEVASLLDGVLQEHLSVEERLKRTNEALEFFRTLAKQAAINSQVPQQDIPAGVRQLAKEPSD